MKKLTIILTILAISMIFAQGSYSAMDDKSDRLSNEQSNVFSPGYINASMQKTKEIINQTQKNKSPLEMRSDTMEDKLSNKVAEDNADKPELELKKKKGGPENTTQKSGIINEEFVVQTATTANNVVVESALNKIAADNNIDKGAIKYDVLNDGNTLFSWISGGKIYGQSYNEKGAPLQESGFVITDSAQAGSVYALKPLNNGKFVVFYKDPTSTLPKPVTDFVMTDAYGRDIRQFSGNGVKDISLVPGGTGSSSFPFDESPLSITALNDGGFAVGWKRNIRIFNSDGIAQNTIELKNVTPEKTWVSYSCDRPELATLSNGNIVALWTMSAASKSYYGVFNTQGEVVSAPQILASSSSNIKVVTLSDGNIVLASSDGLSNLTLKVYSPDFVALTDTPITMRGGTSQAMLKPLSNGDFVIADREGGGSYGMYGQVFSFNAAEKKLEAVGAKFIFSDSGNAQVNLRDQDVRINALADGTFAVSFYNSSSNQYAYKQYGLEGQPLTYGQIMNFAPINFGDNGNSAFIKSFGNMPNDRVDQVSILSSLLSDTGKTSGMNSEMVASVFKGLLNNKEDLILQGHVNSDPALLTRIIDDAMSQSALAVPIENMAFLQGMEMEMALVLANILKNPTEDQKSVLNAVESLLKDVTNIEQETGSPELKKTSDDLLQMVAAVLIAQAIPDLLKEGDVANIKTIFSDLNTDKSRILLEYQDSIRPYYEEIARELSKNMDVLQLKNILSKNMTRKELENLPPNELDKIMQKLRAAKDRSFESEYIIQQESKYHKQYVDPNKKVLEEKMKVMMQDFTKRISKTLENAAPKKK